MPANVISYPRLVARDVNAPNFLPELEKALREIYEQALRASNQSNTITNSITVSGSANVIIDLHANRTLYDPTAYPVGYEFFERDRDVLYVVRVDTTDGIQKWFYSSGMMYDTVANRPADLTTTDANFTFYATNTTQESYWTGSAWVLRNEVEGRSALTNAGAIPKVSATAGTLAESAITDDGATVILAAREFQLDNAKGILQKNLAGTVRNLLVHFSDDKVYLDNADGDVVVRPKAGNLLDITEAAKFQKTVTTYNNIAVEGYGVPAIVDVVELGPRNTDIGATAFTNADVAGLYEVWVYLQTTTADAAAGQLTFTLSYQDSTGATTKFFTHVLTTTARNGGPYSVDLAAGSITYTVALTSGAYGTSQYKFSAWCNRVK